MAGSNQHLSATARHGFRAISALMDGLFQVVPALAGQPTLKACRT